MEAVNTLVKEYQQLDDLGVSIPMKSKALTYDQKQNSLNATDLIMLEIVTALVLH